MCSDSEQPFEGNQPCLIFSSYQFRNQKKNKCCAQRAASTTARAEIEFSCSLFSRLGLLHSRVNPRACASPPDLQSRGPCSAPDTVSAATLNGAERQRKSCGFIVSFCQNLQYLLYLLFCLWRDACSLWNYTAHSHFSVYSNKAS